VLERRSLLCGAAVAAVGTALATSAKAQHSDSDPAGTTPPPRNWDEPATVIYPDPAFEVFDPRFNKYNSGTASIRRIWTGGTWTEGPVRFGDFGHLLFSDMQNNRIVAYNTTTGHSWTFRQPSQYSNGNTRDRQGRLVTCEQGTRRVTRTEYGGQITVIADKYEGKPLNSPNGVIVKSDDTIWFTDPTYGIESSHEGWQAEPELPRNVYRFRQAHGRGR
jgi:gluconolactonase